MNDAVIFIDAFLVIVVIISAIKAWSDGFLTAVISLLGTLGSVLAGRYAAGNYSQVVFDNYFKNSLVDRTYSYLVQAGRNIDIQTVVSSVLGNFPEELVAVISEKAGGALSGTITPSAETAGYLVEQLIGPLAVSVIGAVLFLTCFAAVKIICTLLAKLLKVVNSVPVIGFANRLAGFVAGIGIGGVNIILLSLLMSIIVLLSGDSLPFLNSEIMAQSRILSYTAPLNPFLS